MLIAPLAFLAAGAVAVMAILSRNLSSLERESGAMWKQLQESRNGRIDAVVRLIDAARASGTADEKALHAAAEACDTARTADNPCRAAEADDSLFAAQQALTGCIEAHDAAALEHAPFAAILAEIDRAKDRVATCQGLYNNRVTMYANAGCTFPTLLVAKRLGFSLRERYLPHAATGLLAVAAPDGATALAETSPRIMNAYMLWAIGLSDTVLEESPAQQDER